VSHNYLRAGKVNLWFTLTAATPLDLRAEVRRLANSAGVKRWMYLPTVRTYKIGFRLDMGGTGTGRRAGEGEGPLPVPRARSFRVNRRFVRALQHDLPLASRPYRRAGRELGMTEGRIAETLQRCVASGVVRRVAAVLRPVKAGFKSNVMVAWAVSTKAHRERLGASAAAQPRVSHCYERLSYPRWPYSVYTMIHGRSLRECRNVIRAVAAEAGVSRYRELPTLKEYKKVRVEYFAENRRASRRD
jgi:siroheme decarboxylase